jgi:hypothetical protein
MPAAKGERLDVRLPARQWGERVAIGIPGGHGVEIGRNAYHAFTEGRFYIAPTPVGARAYRIGRRDGVPRPGFIFRRTL